MAKYLKPMNEEYIRKNFPNGFFEGVQKNTQSSGKALRILAIIFLIPFIPVCLLGIGIAISGLVSGDSDSVSGGIFLTALGLLFVIPALIFYSFGKKYTRKDSALILKEWADRNKFPESTIQDFGNQVLNHDTLILHLAGDTNAKSNIGAGFLTRDFLSLTGVVLKLEDLAGVCYAYEAELLFTGSKASVTHSPKLVFVANNGCGVTTKYKKAAVEELLSALTPKAPNMRIDLNKTLSEKEFEEYLKQLVPNS